MSKMKIVILLIISIMIISGGMLYKFMVDKFKKIEQMRIEREKATPTEIENVTLYEKKQVLKLLKEQYPEDEFEIILYANDIHKSPSKWSPSDRKVGKKFVIRPNGQMGEEFLVDYYDNDEDKLFSTPIKPIIKSYYKDEETVEARRVGSMIEEYMKPILDEFLEEKERFKDYNVFYEPITSNLDGLKRFKNINDYFYMEIDNGKLKNKRNIYMYIYINENDFNEEELYIYYDSFQKIANELFRKIDYEKSSNNNIETYFISIKIFKLGEEDFKDIQSLDSKILRLLRLNKLRNNDYYRYNKKINIENGEVIDETSFELFQDVW